MGCFRQCAFNGLRQGGENITCPACKSLGAKDGSDALFHHRGHHCLCRRHVSSRWEFADILPETLPNFVELSSGQTGSEHFLNTGNAYARHDAHRPYGDRASGKSVGHADFLDFLGRILRGAVGISLPCKRGGQAGVGGHRGAVERAGVERGFRRPGDDLRRDVASCHGDEILDRFTSCDLQPCFRDARLGESCGDCPWCCFRPCGEPCLGGGGERGAEERLHSGSGGTANSSGCNRSGASGEKTYTHIDGHRCKQFGEVVADAGFVTEQLGISATVGVLLLRPFHHAHGEPVGIGSGGDERQWCNRVQEGERCVLDVGLCS